MDLCHGDCFPRRLFTEGFENLKNKNFLFHTSLLHLPLPSLFLWAFIHYDAGSLKIKLKFLSLLFLFIAKCCVQSLFFAMFSDESYHIVAAAWWVIRWGRGLLLLCPFCQRDPGNEQQGTLSKGEQTWSGVDCLVYHIKLDSLSVEW